MAVYVGTIGLPIYLDLGLDISAVAAAVRIRCKKPTGTVVTWTPTIIDATNGLIRYTTVSGDLDTEGTYYLNAKWCPLGTGDDDVIYGDKAKLEVEALP